MRRGVSEALGFVFVFAIIVSTTGVVYTFGMGGLQDTRDVERVNNAERAFDVLATNVDDVVRRGAPSRATEVKLADARLDAGDAVVINVSGERYGHPADNFSYAVAPAPVVYDAGSGESLTFVSGAVVRAGADPNASAVVRRPGWLLDENATMVTLVTTRFPRGGQVAGSTTALVRVDRVSTQVPVQRSADRYNVTLTVTSPRAGAWQRALAERDDVTCERPAANETACRIVGTDRVAVSHTILDVDFE